MADEMAQDASLITDFLTECDELLGQLDQDLIALEAAPQDADLVNRVFRAFHTVKGTSGFMGFKDVVSLTHQAEDLLNLMRKGERPVTRPAIDAFLSVLDQLRRMLNDIRLNTPKTYDISSLLGRLRILAAPPAPDRPMLGEILVVEGTISHSEQQEALQHSIATRQKFGQALIEKKLATPQQVDEALSKQAAANDVKEVARTIRVDVNKLDDLVNLTGELVLERNRIAQICRDFTSHRYAEEVFQEALNASSRRLSLITEQLQQASLKTRMLPIDVVFRRFPRMVRDLANKLGKEVALEIRGEDTELDKTIVEEIADPLVHLIRNSLDHGLEEPAARQAAGKPKQGMLRLEARQEGDYILIQVSDDGKGIDARRVAAKAIEKGVVTARAAADMTEREMLDMIFLPGFSTAEKTSDISGRGVGMDVVRTNLKKLNGSVELDSAVGRGATVTLKLPLTLAILPVLLVKASGETYALPLRCVSEIVRVAVSDVHRSDSGEILRVRNQILPLGRVQRIFHHAVSNGNEEGHLRIVVLSIAEKKLGLVVDEFLGQEETIVRPLSSQLGHLPGVAGGTITGEGNIRLILDPAGLAEMFTHQEV